MVYIWFWLHQAVWSLVGEWSEHSTLTETEKHVVCDCGAHWEK